MNDKDFDGLVAGLTEAIAWAAGDDVPGVRVRTPAEAEGAIIPRVDPREAFCDQVVAGERPADPSEG